jgi:hypothetical protein
MQIHQESKHDKHEKGFVKLRRVQVQVGTVGRIDRDAGILMAKLGEMHAPWQVRRFTPTATGRKTALPAKGLAERHTRRKSVSDLPERQLIIANKKNYREKPAEQRPVKNSAGP